MSQVYKVIEVVGVSPNSYAEATREAIRGASQSLHDMKWFEVVEERGLIDGGEVKEFQVTVKIGFRVMRSD